MMTLLELSQVTINPDVAREAYDQASKRLADILDTKKTYDQKAFTLFSGFLTITVAVLGVAGAIYKDNGPTHLVSALALTGIFFIAATICLVLSLLDGRYGALGSDPEVWLSPGVIDGNADALPSMLAYIVYHHQQRIDVSAKANERKAALIKWGIFLGIAAPAVFALVLLSPPPT